MILKIMLTNVTIQVVREWTHALIALSMEILGLILRREQDWRETVRIKRMLQFIKDIEQQQRHILKDLIPSKRIPRTQHFPLHFCRTEKKLN